MVPTGVQVADAFTRYKEFEAQATEIVQNQPLFIPGLVQTAAYATAVLTAITGLSANSEELRARVDERMERAAAFRKRLEGPEPPKLTTVLDESVLRRPVGGAAVMREQLQHLAELASTFPTVQLVVQLTADGAHAGLGGAFDVLIRPDAEPVVFFEGPQHDLVADDAATAKRSRVDLERLMASPIKGHAAIEFVEKISAAL